MLLNISCSAGVGRTGTLITIQSMMKMIDYEGKVDVFNFVLGMRCQRNLMVQTEVHVKQLLTILSELQSPQRKRIQSSKHVSHVPE